MSDVIPNDKINLIELNDCGKASEITRGVPIGWFFELGSPPFNKLILF